jgi:hypothetical protein
MKKSYETILMQRVKRANQEREREKQNSSKSCDPCPGEKGGGDAVESSQDRVA